LDNLEFILLETVPALERATERGEFDNLWSMPPRFEVWLERPMERSDRSVESVFIILELTDGPATERVE
jgi:hypothetical protein